MLSFHNRTEFPTNPLYTILTSRSYKQHQPIPALSKPFPSKSHTFTRQTKRDAATDSSNIWVRHSQRLHSSPELICFSYEWMLINRRRRRSAPLLPLAFLLGAGLFLGYKWRAVMQRSEAAKKASEREGRVDFRVVTGRSGGGI